MAIDDRQRAGEPRHAHARPPGARDSSLDPLTVEPGERRTAVVIGRGGPAGSSQTMATLQSLIAAWSEHFAWDVVLLAPRDEATEALVDLLGGDITVQWDQTDAAAVVEEVHRRGSTPSVVVAGDVVPPVRTTGPVVVPLVDRLAGDPKAGTGARSMSTFSPEADGSGRLQWERAVDPSVKYPVVVFTTTSVTEVIRYRARSKVAWLVESPEVFPEAASVIQANPHMFDLVITNDASLTKVLPRAVTVPVGGTFIPPADQRIPVKTRGTSMVASGKQLTSGHRLRHEVLSTLSGVDVYGRGLQGIANLGPVDNKADALLPYRYSIAIENSRVDDYFTEKVIDCFLTGTIPIYWGTPAVTEHFNASGILSFSTVEELHDVLRLATPEHYAENMPAVRENFELAGGWRAVEDRLLPHLLPYL